MLIIKILKATLFILIVLSLSDKVYADIDFNKIYGLRDKRDKEELYKIIDEAEKIIKADGLSVGQGFSPALSKPEAYKLLGIAYHNLGVLEVRGAPDKAVEYLERAYKLSSEDYEVLAYLGSAKTMVARDSWNVFTKVSRVNEGINKIDKAVSKSPDNIAIRMVRAINTLKLPEFLNRKHIALKDFLH